VRTVFVVILILAFAVVGCEERGTGSDETTSPHREENTQGEGTQGDTARREQQEDVFTPVTVSLVGTTVRGPSREPTDATT
jgi:hypothetical protein